MYILPFLIVNIVNCTYELNKTLKDEEYLAKDITDINMTIHLEEYESIPKEPNMNSTGIEVCKNSLLRNYEDAVYALSEHNGCDVKLIASWVYDHRTILSDKSTSADTTKKHDLTAEESKLCNKSKISARCSSYLKFANCVYLNHINVNLKNVKNSITLTDEAKLKIDNKLIERFVESGSGRLGFLFNETLGHLCRFVHNACDDIHPQFESNDEYFNSQACAIFDIVTPLYTFTQLSSTRHELLTRFYKHNVKDLVESQLYIPFEVPINNIDELVKYQDILCANRCKIVEDLIVKEKVKYALYLLCIHLILHCKDCAICKTLGING